MKYQTLNKVLDWADYRTDLKARKTGSYITTFSKTFIRGTATGFVAASIYNAATGDNSVENYRIGFVIAASIELILVCMKASREISDTLEKL